MTPTLVLTGRRTEATAAAGYGPGSGDPAWAPVTLLGRPGGAGSLDHGPRGRTRCQPFAEEAIRSWRSSSLSRLLRLPRC